MESLERCQHNFHEAMSTHHEVSSRHKQSKSDSAEKLKENKLDLSPKSSHHLKLDMGKDKRHADPKRGSLTDTEVQCTLNQKSTEELVKEIAVLEVEVMHLEKYLLSLYRKAFEQQMTTSPPTTGVGDRLMPAQSSQQGLSGNVTRHNISSKRLNPLRHPTWMSLPQKSSSNMVNEDYPFACKDKLVDAAVRRAHSSLSYRSFCSVRMSPSSDSLSRAFQPCHSQPLSFLEDEIKPTSGVLSLAEYLSTTTAYDIPETPNKLSEEMVSCMGAIYCKLVDPPLVHYVLPSSPTTSFSSMSALSPQCLGDMWSPGCRRESKLDSRLINPFQVEGLKEFSGPYNSMVEVASISRDGRSLRDAAHLLKHYKTLLHQLERMDPRNMTNEEKLAFWINIHNALVMHAYLKYGIPHNSNHRASLLNKARCIIGGLPINAETILGSILRYRTHCSGQRIRTFLYPRMKLKSGNDWHSYAIKHQEPLLHFAICSGSHSDPAVRIYTPKNLFQQMEAAKHEYIRAAVGIWNEKKMLLPKVIDLYAKHKGLSTQSVMDMINCYLPETLRMAMQRCQGGRSHKIIKWVPHNFAFRYLLSRELTIGHIN